MAVQAQPHSALAVDWGNYEPASAAPTVVEVPALRILEFVESRFLRLRI